MDYWVGAVTLAVLAFVQNISFSVVSRSRNRNNLKYHLIAAFFSNGVWYLTFRSLVTAGMTLDLFWWYCAGTMFGSCLGVKISMKIEKWLGIGSDDHLKKEEPRQVINVVSETWSPAEYMEFKKRLNLLWEQHPQGFFQPKVRDGDHFDEARRMVAGWPEWKRNIGHGLDPSTNTDDKMAPSED